MPTTPVTGPITSGIHIRVPVGCEGEIVSDSTGVNVVQVDRISADGRVRATIKTLNGGAFNLKPGTYEVFVPTFDADFNLCVGLLE